MLSRPQVNVYVRDAGARSLSAPHDWLGRLRVAWVADPDDSPIELAERRA